LIRRRTAVGRLTTGVRGLTRAVRRLTSAVRRLATSVRRLVTVRGLLAAIRGLTAAVRRLTAWGTRFVRGIALVCHEGLPFLFPLADPPAAKQYCNRMFRGIRVTSEFLDESITM
jgi:hypothetical protein